MIKFSLLISNYNNGKFFKDCFQSIAAQTYGNWEAVIIDDGSSDDSVAIIESLIKDEPRCRLLMRKENKGCGYTKRECVELAAGQLCGFLDPDDALMPAAIEKMVAAHQNNPDTVLVYSNLYGCDENLEKQRLYFGNENDVNSGDKFFFNLEYKVFHFTSFVKTAYNKTTGIDPFLVRAVDQDLIVKLSETGRFYYLNEPLYLYRLHKKSMSALNISAYWHWVVIMKAAERRNINVEELFAQHFIAKSAYDKYVSAVEQSETFKISAFFAPFLRRLKFSKR